MELLHVEVFIFILLDFQIRCIMMADTIQRELASDSIADVPATKNVESEVVEKSSTDTLDYSSSAFLQLTAEGISKAAISDKNAHSESTSPGDNVDLNESCRAGDAMCSQHRLGGRNGGWAAIVEAKVALDRAEAATASLQNQMGQAFRAFSQRSTSD